MQLYHSDANDSSWINDVVDSRQTSIADQVAIKLDFVVWLNSLCSRTRRIAIDLARGFSTSEVANKFGVTPGRVSQPSANCRTAGASSRENRYPLRRTSAA